MNKRDQERATRLHDQAMDYAQRALFASDDDVRDEMHRIAFRNESKAAALLEGFKDIEPTRSLLHLSAAYLARKCKEFEEAERLIFIALSGRPSPEVARDLKELYELVSFDQYLEEKELVIEDQDFNLLLKGGGVAPGLVSEGAFTRRFRVAGAIVYRIAEKILMGGGPAQAKAKQAKKSLRDAFTFYMLATEPARSFGVRVRIGHDKQLFLPGEIDPTALAVDEFIDYASLFSSADGDRLEREIPDEEYRRSLRQLFDQLAPDGSEVSLVGVSRKRGSDIKAATMTKPAGPAIESLVEKETEERDRRRKTLFRGRLRYANKLKRSRSHKIIIEDTHGEAWPLLVEPEQMDDIVRPLWERNVVARGEWKTTKTPRLLEIYEDRETAE